MEDRHSRSIIDWSKADYRAEGMLTRKAISVNGHPLRNPCKSHKWDLDQEEGVIYPYCTKCGHTMVLSPNDMHRKRPREESSHSFVRF
jgi:Zn ribbon nucleic-acid-binding protein